MASAQRRSDTRGRPPPKRWVFTRTGSSGARTAQSSSEMRNLVVVRLFGVRARVRFGSRDLFMPKVYQVIRIGTKPAPDTVLGLRDRAILSVGLQVGFRRSEIASLKVGDLHENRGYDALRVVRKGGKKGSLAIHQQTAQRIRDYLAVAGHGEDMTGPLFRPVRGNRKEQDARRHLHPDLIDRVLRKYARKIGLSRGYSAHSMRATFITTALENGASLEDVQSAAGHADPSTTKLYDRRGYNPEKSASFFANY